MRRETLEKLGPPQCINLERIEKLNTLKYELELVITMASIALIGCIGAVSGLMKMRSAYRVFHIIRYSDTFARSRICL